MNPKSTSILIAIALTIGFILTLFWLSSLDSIRGLDILADLLLGLLNMNVTIICTGIIVYHIRKK